MDPTIPETPMETPSAPPPPAPLDTESKEAQFLSLMRSALSEAIAPVMDRMAAIEQENVSIKSRQDTLGRGMDVAIAEAIAPRVGPPAVAPASAAGAAPTAAEVAAIEAVKAASAEPEDSTPAHLRPFLSAMLKPVVEN